MSTRKIIYLINPISGTQGKKSLKEMIHRKTTERQIDFSIRPTNAEGDYTYLLALIEKEKITDIVICGGDGTVSAVAAALKGSDVRVGIIPMGSGNGLAYAANIPKNPAKALEIIFAGAAAYIDAFTINDHFSCMLCGIGFDARVAHEFANQKKRGLQTYVRVSLYQFFKTGSTPFRIHTGNKTIATDAFFISVANGNQFGNHFTIAPKADLQDGLLDIVVVKKMGKFRTFYSVLLQVLGRNSLQSLPAENGKDVLYFQTPSLIIENPQQAPLHIDGDPAPTAAAFTIRVVPRAFQLIQP